jgi:AraC-like DNA-binding protein
MTVALTSIATRDRREASAIIATTFDRFGLVDERDDRPFSFRYFSADEGRFGLSTMRFDEPGGGTGSSEHRLVVAQAVTGMLDVDGANGPIDAGSPFLWSSEPLSARWNQLRLGLVTFDTTALQLRARQMTGDDRLTLRFAGAGPSSDSLAQYWKDVVAHLARVLVKDPALRANDLVVGSAFDLVVGALFAVFANNVTSAPSRPIRGPEATSAVSRVQDYIHEHHAEPLTLTDLIAVARMSGRGLQEAFRRELGTTPSGYLRRVRLRQARQDLRLADAASGTTVERVAHAHGFGDAGRFAAYYRAQFGESPSQTLRS